MNAHEIRVGLIGCGTVGSAFCRALAERREAVAARHGVLLTLAEIGVSRPELPRPEAGDARVHGDPMAVAENPALDIVVEASGAAAAATWLRKAYARRAHVVTANKHALAGDGFLLGALARHDPRLLCDAAVCGAVPIARALRESLAADEVREIRGILNGTTTFVLSRLEEGGTFAESVREAQSAGYAEPDPGYDLSGQDAAAKLAILLTLAWREPIGIDRIDVAGLDEKVEDIVRTAVTDGGRVRLVAQGSRTGDPSAWVAPAVLAHSDPLFAATGVENVITVEADLAGRLVWRGAGAGGRATASALLADATQAARALARRGEKRT